jgi:hypothetical protein
MSQSFKCSDFDPEATPALAKRDGLFTDAELDQVSAAGGSGTGGFGSGGGGSGGGRPGAN